MLLIAQEAQDIINTQNGFDWQPYVFNVGGWLLIAFGWFAAHRFSTQRDEANYRRRERSATLSKCSVQLARIGMTAMGGTHKNQVNDVMEIAMLIRIYGTKPQHEKMDCLLSLISDDLTIEDTSFGGSAVKLAVMLADDFRKELGLEDFPKEIYDNPECLKFLLEHKNKLSKSDN